MQDRTRTNCDSCGQLSSHRRRPTPSTPLHPALPLLAAGLGAAAVLPPAGVRADSRQERMIGPGVKHTTLRRSKGPWSIQVVEVDTREPEVRLSPAVAPRGGFGVLRLSAQAVRATSAERYPIAGVNGDFFVPDRGRFQGMPIGAALSLGEVVHSPYPRSALILGKNGQVRIGMLRLHGYVVRADGTEYPIQSVNHPRDNDALVLYTSRFGTSTRTAGGGVEVALTPESLPLRHGEYRGAIATAVRRGGDTPIPAEGLVLSGHGAGARFLSGVTAGDQLEYQLDFDPPLGEDDDVIGGGPRLVRDGRVTVEDEANIIARAGGRSRHPRTAVGIKDGTAVLVTVDGRRRGVSVGMTMWELGRLMASLGCSDAMALDGGGSTAMWVRGEIKNRPSDGRERPVASGLFVFSTAPHGPAARLSLTPNTLAMVAGASATVKVSAQDRGYNPVSVAPKDLKWTVEPPVATVDASGRLKVNPDLPPGEPIEATAWAEVGEGREPVRIRVYPSPPRLEVTPKIARLKPGQAVRLRARVTDERGGPLLYSPASVRWECAPGLGKVTPNGQFVAGSAGAGWLVASLNATTARIPVSIGTVPRVVEDFETEVVWKEAAFPAAAHATTDVFREAAGHGQGSLRLRYNFAGCTGTRVAAAKADVTLGAARGLRLLLWGDGSGSILRARLRDARGKEFTVDLCAKIAWKDGWREVYAAVPTAATAPLKLESVYVVQTAAGLPDTGTVLIDHVRADYVPTPDEGDALTAGG